MKRFFITLLAALTLFCSTAPMTQAHAAEPTGIASVYSSDYLSSYNGFALKGSSSGELDISYEVIAPIRASKIGVKKIEVYKESGSKVATIYGSTANGLQSSSISMHAGTYTYCGTAGTTYYAKVTVFASDSSGSDSRVIITNSVTV